MNGWPEYSRQSSVQGNPTDPQYFVYLPQDAVRPVQHLLFVVSD